MGSAASARRDRQVVRLLTLLRTLKEGGRPSIYELAARFHTRRETIYRDLRALQAIGYPIVGDADGRLSHPSLAPEVRATIPPVLLTQQELAALVWATKQAGSRQPFRAGLDSAFLKLRSLAPGKEGRLGLVLDGIFGGWARGIKDYRDFQPIILQLVEAIVARRRCLLTYQAPSRDRPNKFRYDPYRLLSIQGLLYCVGQVPVHDSLVTLAIDRIHGVTVTEEPFTVDPQFDLKQYEAEAFGVMWDKPMTVVVRFRPDQAPYVREREWHPTQKLRTLRDGRLELTFRAGGTFEITRWILGWGDGAEAWVGSMCASATKTGRGKQSGVVSKLIQTTSIADD
jgi:predicted DNA-binding transcriptional regulator YafY